MRSTKNIGNPLSRLCRKAFKQTPWKKPFNENRTPITGQRRNIYITSSLSKKTRDVPSFCRFPKTNSEHFLFFPPSYVKKNKLVSKKCRIHEIIKKFVQVKSKNYSENSNEKILQWLLWYDHLIRSLPLISVITSPYWGFKDICISAYWLKEVVKHQH